MVMANKSKKELENEDSKDARKSRNELWDIFFRGAANLAFIIGAFGTVCYLAHSPESLKEFLNLLKNIFSNYKTYWAIIGGLGISNIAIYKLYSQKNDTVAKLEEALQNYLPQNNKTLLTQIEELLKKYKN